MITVWCVCVGDKYDSAYVYALRDMVATYLTIEHDFLCITTRKLDGIQTVLPYAPYQGWWSKINLFAPGMARGPSLYFDLDVVITQNIDYLKEYTKHQFSAPANWAKSGHGGIQSSVMAWSGDWTEPFNRFDYQADPDRLWGDQEFLWELLQDDWVRIPGIGSYKYHCKQGLPPDIKVCVFHGKPDPHEISDLWLLPYISTRLSTIK